MSLLDWRSKLTSYRPVQFDEDRRPAYQSYRTVFNIAVALILMAVMFLPYQSILASSVPTIDIVSVVVDDEVTIRTHNYPAGRSFTVRMGEYGTYGIGGSVVGSFDSGAGGSFELTFSIPTSLQGRTRIAIRADGSGGYYSYNWFNNQPASSDDSAPSDHSVPTVPAYSGIPTFSILEVAKDDNVSLKFKNYPAGQTFTVRMGEYGTLGIGGIVVGSFESAGGSFNLDFDIPSALHGRQRIAIRADSPQGYFSYNWFWNNPTTSASSSSSSSSSSTSASSSSTSTSGYTGIPSFKIIEVDRNNSVTIRTHNFPGDQAFVVRMGEYGTLGVGGTVVDTTDSGSGGAFEKTYTIPAALHGRTRIAIRLESADGYFAYNWFWNNTADVSGSSSGTSSGSTSTSGTGGYSGIPTFSITAVVHDTTVTVNTRNYPPAQTFTVRMGEYGTLGVGGTEVGTFDSNSGGNATATFNIPAGLAGRQRIAIRMDSGAGFFAYNWFWNNTAP